MRTIVLDEADVMLKLGFKEDIEKVRDPENWILQRKVKYADVIETPDIPAKAEIRIFYFWNCFSRCKK